MRQIIYHVAVTLDGFIAHADGSTDGFLESGEHVTDYLQQLHDYDTVIMGRRTYEFGYNYGLTPGQPAYPHMHHYIFSKSLRFDAKHEQVEVVADDEVGFVKALKNTVGSPIYLCGGGEFAGFLLKHGLIDELKLKINPVLFGAGIGLFGSFQPPVPLEHLSTVSYGGGVSLARFKIQRGSS